MKRLTKLQAPTAIMNFSSIEARMVAYMEERYTTGPFKLEKVYASEKFTAKYRGIDMAKNSPIPSEQQPNEIRVKLPDPATRLDIGLVAEKFERYFPGLEIKKHFFEHWGVTDLYRNITHNFEHWGVTDLYVNIKIRPYQSAPQDAWQCRVFFVFEDDRTSVANLLNAAKDRIYELNTLFGKMYTFSHNPLANKTRKPDIRIFNMVPDDVDIIMNTELGRLVRVKYVDSLK